MIYSMTAYARKEVKRRLGLSGMGNPQCKPALPRNLFPHARTIPSFRTSSTRAFS